MKRVIKVVIGRIVVKVGALMIGRNANVKRVKRVLRQRMGVGVRERVAGSIKSRGRKKSISGRKGGKKNDFRSFTFFDC